MRVDESAKDDDDTKAAFEALGGDPEDEDSHIRSEELIKILRDDFKMTLDIEKMIEDIDEVRRNPQPRMVVERLSMTNSSSFLSLTLQEAERMRLSKHSLNVSVNSKPENIHVFPDGRTISRFGGHNHSIPSAPSREGILGCIFLDDLSFDNAKASSSEPIGSRTHLISS